jgi:4-alpha-glucanotransferase
MVSLEDLQGSAYQVNLPGTTDEYPNWQRRLPVTLEQLVDQAGVQTISEAMKGCRAELR